MVRWGFAGVGGVGCVGSGSFMFLFHLSVFEFEIFWLFGKVVFITWLHTLNTTPSPLHLSIHTRTHTLSTTQTKKHRLVHRRVRFFYTVGEVALLDERGTGGEEGEWREREGGGGAGMRGDGGRGRISIFRTA